jgi:hypothetical protein
MTTAAVTVTAGPLTAIAEMGTVMEGEGGEVSTHDCWLNIQILTPGGLRWTMTDSTTKR